VGWFLLCQHKRIWNKYITNDAKEALHFSLFRSCPFFAHALCSPLCVPRIRNGIEQQIQLFGIPQDIESATALAHNKDDRLRKEFEKWAILTYTDNHAKINDKKGSDHGIDGIAYILDGGKAVFSVKSGNVSVKDVRDLRGVIERESAAAGILLTLEEPTKPMLQEAAASGYIDDIPGVTMPKKTLKLQIVTIQKILDGVRMNLPLPESVVKSAGRRKYKDGNQQIDFDDGKSEPQA
jgi:site-specific DNA-methyltransferase (adenine-specific)